MLLKFGIKSAQKTSIFPKKASFERSLFYNRQRIHSTLEYTPPEAFENNYREKQMLCS